MTGRKVLVIGSGPIRIGQGIEFDYASVHCVWALRALGCEAVIVNNNPETVSTDFDTSDRLFFEPLALEDVLNVVDREQPDGIIVQFGGQTAINLARPLHDYGCTILGTSVESIELSEDRDKFERLLSELGIAKPAGRAITTADQAIAVAEEIGYPVLVRPSFVLGGRAMEIVYGSDDLRRYMGYVTDVSPRAPILVDKYIVGKEVEVDVVSDGETCVLPGIMEHIERAGVHSGDSMAVYPPQSLSADVIRDIERISIELAQRLEVRGLMNVQYVVERGTDSVQVIEVNPRASRTVPYLSKITGVPMVDAATRAILGKPLAEQGYVTGIVAAGDAVAVKAPVFSFLKLAGVDINLGPEMKSTGEIMGLDGDYPRALYKAMVASGVTPPAQGTLVATIADHDKPEALPILRDFEHRGFRIVGTSGTAAYLRENGVPCGTVGKISEGEDNIVSLIQAGKVALLINTLSSDRRIEREAALIRRASVEAGVPCMTSLDTARALLVAIGARAEGTELQVGTVDEYCPPAARVGAME